MSRRMWPAIVLAAVTACGGGRAISPAPVTPIAAEPDPPSRPAAEVCGALVSDLDRYQACVPDNRKSSITAWLERAKIDFAALAADGVSDGDRAETARACAKADDAVQAALAGCPAP